MCTAISYNNFHHYFGRNLDLDRSLGEEIIITPRSFPLCFRHVKKLDKHYSMIGIGIVIDNYPLYYDATNERGLSIAGLNFPKSATYLPQADSKINIASYEFIPWILSNFETVAQTREALLNVRIVDTPFSDAYPPSPLHWMISDKKHSITVEPLFDGIHVYENPVGILTNEPPFAYQMTNLCNYMNITSDEPTNRFSDKIALSNYSHGMGALGLPGDLSSCSRFVRGAFTKLNSIAEKTSNASISQFFHILGSVAQINGCAKMGQQFERTIYASCCDTDTSTYYYKTYNNSQISGICLHINDTKTDKITTFPLIKEQQINMQN